MLKRKMLESLERLIVTEVNLTDFQAEYYNDCLIACKQLKWSFSKYQNDWLNQHSSEPMFGNADTFSYPDVDTRFKYYLSLCNEEDLMVFGI
jgi:hypothetical protein